MKYRQWLVSSCAPASLQEWLAEELERRGIDGVYTRYILSLLLADTIDPAECAHVVAHSRANIQAHCVSENRVGDKSRHRRLKCWDRRKEQQGLLVPHCQQHAGQCCDCSLSYLDSEQRKKLAAVECLKSASEQKSGIEKLIDEVCAKLKNFQADIETNPVLKLHAEIKDFSKPSPPQEQAELYYSAFPALSGKSDRLGGTGEECQTSPQEQEAWRLKPTVWGKENHGCAEKQLPDIQTLLADGKEEEKENAQNDLGKETTTETKPDFPCFSEIPLNKFDEEIQYVKNLEFESQPLFIVPKMKTPATKVANITMYTPFTCSALYHSQGIGIRKAQREDDGNLGEGREKEDVKKFEDEDEDTLQSEDRLCLTSKLLLANVSLEENDMVTDLASKFNSELASIWDTGECIPEISLNSHNLDFSFRILSVRSPVQDVPVSSPTSVNFLIGSNLPSVWSAKKEDIKILNGQVISELQELCMTIPLVPNLVHNKMELSGEDVLIWSSEEESDLCLDDGSSQSCKLDLSEQAWEVLSTHTCDAESEEQSNVFLCSETSLPAFEEHERPHSSSSNCVSPLDNTVEAVKGIYKLWESPSPQPPFPLTEVLQMPHTTAPYGERVVNWISNQRNVASPDWHALSTQNEKCTLTYHKGESRFKEVVPLTRAKAEVSEQLSSENKMSLPLEDFNKDMLCKPEEPEENLLTSPKTHFQPISQDSSETESLSDPTDIIETQLIPSPQRSVHQSPLVVNESITLKEEEIKPDKTESNDRISWSASSSMDEMLFLTGELEGGERADKSKIQKSSKTVDLLQAFHSSLKTDLLSLEDKSTSTDSCSTLNRSRDELAILGFAQFDKDQIWSTDTVEEQRSDLSLAWKWSTADDSDELTWKAGLEDSVEEAFDNDSTKFELDCTLKAMRRELEEEEEELFRDINLLSDSEDFEAAFQDDFVFPLNGSWALADEDDEICDVDDQMEPQLLTDQWEHDLVEQDLVFVEDQSFLDESKIEDSEPVELPSVPAEKALYSTELESEWYKSSLSFSVQLPKKSKVKKTHCQKQQPQHQQQHRKPCTFFLEGNCRRSDCKFSHNLGSITCRFWEEGSCFKGETCPFLHGYSSDPEFGEINSAKCKFALESEADFPSLSTLSSSEPSSKPFPKELVVGRIIRPKKKKMGLTASAVSGIKKANSPLPSK